jgi:hypothetical protein
MLTDMVRTDSHQLRAVASDSRARGRSRWWRGLKTLIWERTRQTRLRHQLREYFPAALGLRRSGRADALELLGGTGPGEAAKLTRAQISASLKRARAATSSAPPRSLLRAALAGPAVPSPPPTCHRPLLVAVINLNKQVKPLQGQVERILAVTRTPRSTCPSPAWDPSLPGPRRVRRRPGRQRQGPQNRWHLPAHPRVGERRWSWPGSSDRLIDADGPGPERPGSFAWPGPLRRRAPAPSTTLPPACQPARRHLHGCLKTRTLTTRQPPGPIAKILAA